MATSISTLAQAPPLVPAETYKEKRDQSPEQPEECLEWLKGLCKRLRLENSGHNKDLWNRHLYNENMYRGNQLGIVDLEGNFRPFKREKGDPRYIMNVTRGHTDAVVSSHVLAKTDIDIIALPPDDATDDATAKARAAANIVNYYEHEIFTDTFRINESLLRQFGGGLGRLVLWDAKAGYQLIQRPILSNSPFRPPVSDTFTCSFCGESGKLEDALEGYGTMDEDLERQAQPECPYCHSNELSVTKVEAMEMPVASGYEDMPSGDCRVLSVPMYQLDFDRTGTDFYEAQWLKWSRRFRPEVIKELFPWWKGLKGSEIDETDSYGLKVGERLKDTVGERGGKTGRDTANAPNLVTVEQWWIKPCMIATAPPLRKDFKIGDPNNPSMVIPKGSRLKDVFKEGLYALTVEREPVDFRSEDFCDFWVHINYKPIPSKIEGDGNEDQNELQRMLNMINALRYTDIRMTAAPPTYYDANAVKNADLVGRPDVNVPVRLTRQGQSLQDVAWTPQGRQMPPHVAQFADYLMSVIQWMNKTSNTSTGQTMLAEGVGERTATGAKLVAQGAATQRAPENSILADGDVRTVKLLLKHFIKNATDARCIPTFGKSGKQDYVKLKGSDLGSIDKEILLYARPGSNVPRGPEDEQMAYANAMQLVGGPEGILLLSQSAPEFLREIERVFNIKFHIGELDLDARQCRLRLDKMKAALPQVQQLPPEYAVPTLLASAPITKYDAHEAARRYYMEWLKQDEAMEVGEPLFTAVQARIEEHKQALKALAAEKMADEMELQAPLQEQAKTEAMEQQGMQAEAQQAQAEQQMGMEAQKAEQDAAVRDEQRQAGLEDKAIEQMGKEEDHRRALQLEAVKQAGQKEIARTKGKTDVRN